MKKNLFFSIFTLLLVGFIACTKDNKEVSTETATTTASQTIQIDEYSTFTTWGEPENTIEDRDAPCCSVTFGGAGAGPQVAFNCLIPKYNKYSTTIVRQSDGATWTSVPNGPLPRVCTTPAQYGTMLPPLINTYFNNCEDNYKVTFTILTPNAFGQYVPCSSASSDWVFVPTGNQCF